MDADRVNAMQCAVEAGLSPDSKQQIMQLLGQIDNLSGAEKLLLYLKLPTGPPSADPLKQPINPLGSRSEIQQTVMWIQTHLEVDPEISLPKKDVYEEYTDYCASTKMKPLSTADFGKVMKQVYPCVKPRRLGTRGNSRYCYAGMRKRIKLEVPKLPDLGDGPQMMEISTNHTDAVSCLIKEWAEKHLGNKFGNLHDLARHLLEKNLVDHTSAAAHTLANSFPRSTDHQDSFDSKNEIKHEIQQRGVIKQLKRKIQAQPHHALKSMRKAESFEESTDVEDSSESTQLNSSFTEQKIPVKTEVSSVSSEYNSQPNLIVARNKDYNISNIIEPSNELAPAQPHPFNSNYCKDYTQNTAVNLTQSSFSRGRNSPQFLTSGAKNPSIMTRGQHLNYDPFKCPTYTPDNQPTNLSVNSFAMCNSDNVYSHAPPNLPINLSNSNVDGNETSALPFKESISYKNLDGPCVQSRNDSLNLSTNRRDWLPQDSPNVVPKLSLPGKKIFLETYNANQNMLSSMNYNDQMVKPSQSSDPGQYLPKKMRATESFGSKLTSARFFANASVDSQQMKPEKYNNKVVMDEFPPPSPKLLQNIVPNPNLAINYENIVMNEPVVDHSPPQNLNSPNMISADHKLNMLEPKNIQLNSRRGLKNVKNKKSKIKSPDTSTNSFSDNVECIQRLPVKTRGRPRKKSLSKAKDVRKLTRANAMNHLQCEHKKHSKRSSDSFSSLTECINIKTGIICAEKHAEILNRERVHSICNMDKHALDDYLNEGNSQEHEEELMRYFQSNDENPVAENTAKSDLEEMESTSKGGKLNGLYVDKTDVAPSDTGVITSKISKCATKETSLDIHEDHSQGKNEKISQLREILQKIHNSNLSTISNDEKANNSEAACGFTHSTAFATITRRKVDGDNFEYKEGSAAASLTMLSMKQQSNAAERPSAINVRRRVSFEKPAKESNEQQNVPPSPTSRLQQFIFMPISPGRSSPVSSNKNSPTVASYKPSSSPSKNLPAIPCTSPVSLSSSASPFVSPRNTPVPRARNSCHEKPVPSKFQSKKMLPRLGITKCSYVGEKPREMCNINHLPKGHNELGNFIIPNDQSTVPRSPSYMPKVRTFPMSAPPSPNILTSKYKPNFTVQTSSSPHIMRSMSQDINNSLYVNNEPLVTKDTVQNEPSQPLSADPHSHEISQFFAGNNMCLDDPNNSLRSQSVPLHQNGILADNQAFYNHQNNNPMHNINYLSYNNTPCNSVPPTPIPSEFCDFGSLNDTCESISKGLNSENLDTIYNVLDSNTQEALNKVVEQNEMLLNNDNIAMSNFNQNTPDIDPSHVPLLSDLEPMMFDNNEDLSKIPFGEQLPNKYELPQEFRQSHMLVNDNVKRSNSVEVNVPNTSIDNKFFMSRSVPSTPLPSAKTQMPNFDLNETQIISHFQDDYSKQNCSKGLISKSVPSTPQLTDDRNIFSYSNRDFLINGNSVDPNVSNGFGEKKLPNDQLEQSFLNDSTLIEDKSSSGLVGFVNSPLRETIDMVNNDLAPFNDDCINMDTENDLLNTIL